MKAVKTTEKQEYLFEYSCFFLKIVYRFRNNCIIRVGYSYYETILLDI